MEIVAPAGNFEKLQYALAYNADAVYLAGHSFGLRAFAGNFSFAEIKSGADFAHSLNKKVFVTLNVFAKNKDLDALPEYIQEINKIGIDALIVSEPGTLSTVKKLSNIPIHLSTQANTTNWSAVRFWQDYGVKRVILAREVTYRESLSIRESVPDMELEVFIHGAMCMAWSGRCLMSALLNERSANLGECTHPCRWEWILSEPTRPGQVFSLEQDERGSYLMHSKDLCLLKEIPLICSSGIIAGKIEGRMKSTYYTAVMSRTYSEARSLSNDDTISWQLLCNETHKVNHRPYFTAFFYDNDQTDYSKDLPLIDFNQSTLEWQYCGKVTNIENGLVWFDCLSKIEVGDSIEIIFPDRIDDIAFTADKIYNEEQTLVTKTKPNQSFGFPLEIQNRQWGLVRKLINPMPTIDLSK